MRASVFLLLPLLAGCGADSRTPLHPVRGQVLFEGKPVPNALLVLHRPGAAPDVARPHAKIGPDGSFVISSPDGEGAPAGEYGVTVEWFVSKGDDAPPTNRLPARYSRPTSSGLHLTVREGGNEAPTIRLKR